MDYVSAINLLFKAGSGFFAFLKEEEAVSAAISYLSSKYSLGVIERDLAGSTFTAPIFHNYVGQEWAKEICLLLEMIEQKWRSNEDLCVACGELAMFIRIADSRNFFGVKSVAHDRFSMSELRDIYRTETYVSLIEMGRGRGGEFALNLIRKELRNRLPSWI
jgi:hypothetical protein